MKYLPAFFLLFLLSGCGVVGYKVTILTNPPGAFITESGTGRLAGTSPIQVYYSVYDLALQNAQEGKPECWRIKGFEARWPSGATAKTDNPLMLCGTIYEAHTYVINRNSDAPGLDADMANAQQISEERRHQAEIQAYQRQQDTSQLIQAVSTLGQAAIDAKYPQPAPVYQPVKQYNPPQVTNTGCVFRTFTMSVGGNFKMCTQDSFCNINCF